MLSLKLGGVRGRAPRTSAGAKRRTRFLHLFSLHPAFLILSTIPKLQTSSSSSGYWTVGTGKLGSLLKVLHRGRRRPHSRRRGRRIERTPTIPAARDISPQTRGGFIQNQHERYKMHSYRGSPHGRTRSASFRLSSCLSDSASEWRYSERKGLPTRISPRTGHSLPKFRGGRAPPGRRRRPELQAMSNSLQLASI